MSYKNIIVIGFGSISKQVFNIAKEYFKDNNVEYISSSYNLKEKDKEELDKLFNSLENNLIISANNFYIFKDECINKNKIINYHNSLLPKHKGTHAHVFAIFDGDDKTGITWHIVTKEIDKGSIIYSASLPIEKEDTAISLITKQQELALNGLNFALDNLINKKFMEQDPLIKGSFHKRSDLPNNGIFDKSFDFNKMCLFLRAMDCGRGMFRSFPLPRIQIKDTFFNIDKYEIHEDEIILSVNKEILTFRR